MGEEAEDLWRLSFYQLDKKENGEIDICDVNHLKLFDPNGLLLRTVNCIKGQKYYEFRLLKDLCFSAKLYIDPSQKGKWEYSFENVTHKMEMACIEAEKRTAKVEEERTKYCIYNSDEIMNLCQSPRCDGIKSVAWEIDHFIVTFYIKPNMINENKFPEFVDIFGMKVQVKECLYESRDE